MFALPMVAVSNSNAPPLDTMTGIALEPSAVLLAKRTRAPLPIVREASMFASLKLLPDKINAPVPMPALLMSNV